MWGWSVAIEMPLDLLSFFNDQGLPHPLQAPPALSLKQHIGKLWIEYLHEDPEERGRERWEHLAKMQRVREEQYPALCLERWGGGEEEVCCVWL